MNKIWVIKANRFKMSNKSAYISKSTFHRKCKERLKEQKKTATMPFATALLYSNECAKWQKVREGERERERERENRREGRNVWSIINAGIMCGWLSLHWCGLWEVVSQLSGYNGSCVSDEIIALRNKMVFIKMLGISPHRLVQTCDLILDTIFWWATLL